MTMPQDVTGEPRWEIARDSVRRLRELPADLAEANVQGTLLYALQALFPRLPAAELCLEKPSGDGDIDVYCRNVVFETKRQGKKDDARVKPDGTIETPEEQAVRYLNALTVSSDLFKDESIGWRAGITDGKEWSFYDYQRDAEPALTLVRGMQLREPEDDDHLLAYLYDFVNRTAKTPPPTDNVRWADAIAQPFIDLAADYENSPAYVVKRTLWRDLLRGAFLTPPDDTVAERDLFARHTMLVVTARAVAETLRQGGQQTDDRDALRRQLTYGFAAWLLDAADSDGEQVLDALTTEVNRYNWSVAGRDTLKDLYHSVIPRNIRHDFGEYYTPDWLARAVCEEVMDAAWRREIIDMAVANQLNGPAVLDPACGSGTFLYHATQLLLADAAQHPELAGHPYAQVEIVNELVAGMDLHPVAVELAKTTKIAAFSALASLVNTENAAISIYLGDSLQWESRRQHAEIAFDDRVTINTDDPDAPLSLPRSFLLSSQFEQSLNLIFDYTKRPYRDSLETQLAAVLALPSEVERDAVLNLYRRLRQYVDAERNHVWHWYISNLAQPTRLMANPPSRLVGNPPWVVYNAMSHNPERQDAFRHHAGQRGLWASAHLAPQNDLAATFVATCVDYYLKPGGKFGFVLPYAALRGRHWGPFRAGDWSLPEAAGRGRTLADLSPDAWNFFAGTVRPFPWANSSAVFGRKLDIGESAAKIKPTPLAGMQRVGNTESVRPRMSWEEAKPLLTFTRQEQQRTEASAAYSGEFRNGATLFPQSLVVFERPEDRGLGIVYFRTNRAKGAWRGTERRGQVEEQFVRPALFSRWLLPFGTSGHSHIIAPFAADGASLLETLPQDAGASRFRRYWDAVDQKWREISSGRPPNTLTERVDWLGKLSAQLGNKQLGKVVYQRSGVWLQSAVVPVDMIADGTLNWFASNEEKELHYLAAIFNAPALAIFFRDVCRASDRHFQMGPMENLPIPAFDAGNEHHANLAAQSELAHRRVAALVAEYADSRRKIGRDAVLRDGAMQPILAAIDDSVRAILPDYCS